MLFYRPENSVAADVIPFYRDEQFHLFYLRDFRNVAEKGEGTPWYHLQTKDFVHYREIGEAIPRGTMAEQDLYIFTGSVFQNKDRYNIFYTGHNPHFTEQGKPCEVICMAESDDLVSWRKNPGFRLEAPDFYEKDDWRDPFVFKHPTEEKFIMLLAARQKGGASRRRGCTAWAQSEDLVHWQVMPEPFYAPQRYYTHECPDLFRMGDWWYLLFSEFSDKVVTRYVMSRSCFGPWTAPENDCLENSICYAAKSASDGNNRYLFGWNRTKVGDCDEGNLQWGGNIVAHKLKQNEDGTLALSLPESVAAYFGNEIPLSPEAMTGTVRREESGAFSLGRAGGYASAKLCKMQPEMLFEAEVLPDETTGEFGLILYGDEQFEEGYTVKFEPAFQRVSVGKWPWNSRGDTFMAETEKNMAIRRGKWQKIQVIVSGTLVEIYFNGQSAASARIYSTGHNSFGVYSANGKVTFRNARAFEKPDD